MSKSTDEVALGCMGAIFCLFLVAAQIGYWYWFCQSYVVSREGCLVLVIFMVIDFVLLLLKKFVSALTS